MSPAAPSADDHVVDADIEASVPGPGGDSQGMGSRGVAGLILRRLLAAVAVLWIVSVIVFLFVHAAPGGPELAIAGTDATPEQLQRIREAYRLDDPLPAQYLTFLQSAVQFDFGTSFTQREPVTTLIWRAARDVTLPLVVITWTLATVLGLSLGYRAARSRGGVADRVIVAGTTLGASTPVFVTSIVISYVFGVRLGWLPFLGIGDGGLDRLKHLVLPSVTATVVLLAATTKHARVRMGHVLDEDQVIFAQARGLSSRYILSRLVLRNSAVYLITASGALVIALMGGLVIVEQVYNLPGIGTMLIVAINQRDIPVVQGIALYLAATVVVINLVVDLACFAIDPRIRRGGRDGTG